MTRRSCTGKTAGQSVAKLRTLKPNAAPLLLHINMDAGHGGASGRYDYLKEIAFDYAFLLTQLGVGAMMGGMPSPPTHRKVL